MTHVAHCLIGMGISFVSARDEARDIEPVEYAVIAYGAFADVDVAAHPER